MSSALFWIFQNAFQRNLGSSRFAAFERAGLPSGPMKNPIRFLIALLFAVPPLIAQNPAAAPAPTAPAPAMKTWFIRLIPPRPTFDKDMTETEQKLMEQHFAYWKDVFAKGICVFGGPVFDSRGVYGVLVIRAAGEDEAHVIASADPVVKAGVSRIEVAQMHIAFPPQT
jgi:uncharacterized protein YciI